MDKLLKRFLDFTFTLVLFVPSAFILFAGMLFVKIVSPESSPIFKQVRVGYRNKHFTLYKLRSMTNERDADGNLLPDELRLKKWGKVVRKTNIDELFQIWNILIGEMSFIGPRPILPKEMLVMTESEQRERQSMRPGITGWEAIHEGKSQSRREMAEFDLFYVRNWSLSMDWKIFYTTIGLIVGFARPDDKFRAPKLNESEFRTNKEVEA
ncbi:sugar transferase [Parabacteroides sp. 20_3]|jgi:lipopolysaccharide/colanic/teichoic acid biosynthesis glycosyltransferase|uniref:Sugar transferase n=1 Tax=Parabacteroides distasonis TaxID=823 RepID=A0A5C6K6D3_PARDI|nr:MULTISPECIES: sugar transferase [Parabacteroides]RGK79445.1 sugar transferase [Parabacteroides sp. 20_3]TWV57984.1 sugar transferase [Parabacteroides distasonis]